MNLENAIAESADLLEKSGVHMPRKEAALLVSLATGLDRTFLIAHPEHELQASEQETLRTFVRRRAAREPFQHLSGHQEFFGLDFAVSPAVLIPRPETEQLVQCATELLTDLGRDSRFCDVGTGSGCIAISIAHTVTTASGLALDISEESLWIARLNAQANRVEDRITFTRSDIFSVLDDQKFDVIVSNPPYVPLDEIAGLQAEVRDFEPHIALTDGSDGLSIIKRIISGSTHFLLPGGWLLLEIGYNQSDRVYSEFNANTWKNVDILPDLQGIPRIVKAQVSGPPDN